MFAAVIAAVFSSVAAPGLAARHRGRRRSWLRLRAGNLTAAEGSPPVGSGLQGHCVRHAVVFAVLAGPAVLATRSLELGHGYWLVLTLAAVLQPASATCRLTARDRLTGTVAGVVLATALVLVLPPSIVLVVATVCAVLTAGWGISQDLERQTLSSPPSWCCSVRAGVSSPGWSSAWNDWP